MAKMKYDLETVSRMLKGVTSLREGRSINKAGGLQAILKEYGPAIKGKPEEGYLTALIRLYADLDLEMDVLPWGVRTANCLRDDGVLYVGELVTKTEAELLSIPNMNRRSLSEVREQLTLMGLSLGMGIEYTRPDKRSS